MYSYGGEERTFSYIHRPVPNAVDDEGEERRRKFKELKKGYKMMLKRTV